jgi:iron complex transport system ATP-binding protein
MTPERYLRVEGLDVVLAGRTVVRDASVAFARRQVVAVVGPNGAGKTSLLRAVAGLVPASGEILVGADALKSLSLAERARRFAYLPQRHSLCWPLPVRDIVALGRYPHGVTDPGRLSAADVQAVATAMAEVEVTGLADRVVTELSGGEKSRVMLARLLAVEAPVILADEPTTSLDPRYQIEVMRLLRRAAGHGALVLVITHDLGLAARFADLVVVMDAGKIVASGPPIEALAPDVLADVFHVRAFRGCWEDSPVIVPWSSS